MEPIFSKHSNFGYLRKTRFWPRIFIGYCKFFKSY